MSRVLLIVALCLLASLVGATDYYTSPSATGGGTGTYASPFTLQEAADAAVAGETVFVLAGTYALSATWDLDTNHGNAASAILFTGRNVSTTSTLEMAVINGAGAGVETEAVKLVVEEITFEYLRITAGVDDNIDIASTVHNVQLFGCRIDNAGGDGIQSANSTGGRYELFQCEIDSNGANGLSINTTLRGSYVLFNCSVHDNIAHGVYEGSRFNEAAYYRSLFYDNGGDGINFPAGGWGARIANCTFFGNTGDGVDFASNWYNIQIESSIFAKNGGYGMNFNSGAVTMLEITRDICSYLNTSGHIDINGGTLPGTGHVLADPAFTSEVDGSEDLTPTNTNLSVERAFPAGGSDYSYIGAIQPECTGVAGGGGPLVGPGRLAR